MALDHAAAEEVDLEVAASAAAETLVVAAVDLVAEDSEEAFSVWREEQGRIDVLLVDVVLPGVRGDEIARQLSAEKPGLKCVFMSGFADEDFVRRSGAPAESRFLPKPFAPHALVELIRQV